MKNRFLKSHKSTMLACFCGYVVPAICNVFVPLLFLTFQEEYAIPIEQITLLISVNFGVQLAVDFLSAYFVDRVGFRFCAVLANACAASGLIGITLLPSLFPSAFTGLLLSTLIYGIGGGLLEVIVSPIVETCPSKNKEKTMSLLHSFYCWGSVAVVLLSSLFFFLFELTAWRTMALLWAVFPILNAVLFSLVPLFAPMSQAEGKTPFRALLRERRFFVFLLLMFASGACELAATQWASAYAEVELGLGKSVGDLLGPVLFSLLAALVRTLYGVKGEKIPLSRFMLYSGIGCLFAYILIAASPLVFMRVFGLALCGAASAILWPGTYSLASSTLHGTTAMFSFLALAGDLGALCGPALIGFTAGLFQNNLRIGFGFAILFPVLLLLSLLLLSRAKGKGQSK
ncbi:MAG: MFS transporter [Clostridia bacterium]|nr:MFS transporter [Clostridia bacterium]